MGARDKRVPPDSVHYDSAVIAFRSKQGDSLMFLFSTKLQGKGHSRHPAGLGSLRRSVCTCTCQMFVRLGLHCNLQCHSIQSSTVRSVSLDVSICDLSVYVCELGRREIHYFV